MRTKLALMALVLTITASAASAQVPDVPFVASPQIVVQRMLELAEVKSGDVVYDLGCGDGRIVIAAVQIEGVKGVCVEIDASRIQMSRENAEKAGVADRIRFVQGDFFEVPIADATVVALYLLPDVNLRLRPRLQSELKPGTRIVSNAFDMGDWVPEKRVMVGAPPENFSEIYRWTIAERPKAKTPAQ
jgi:SAM-dependent methyltransferase